MKSHQMLPWLAAATMIAALSGCSGTAAPEPTAKTKPTTDQSESPADEQADDALTSDETDLLAKITTGAPPKDLLWSFPDELPNGWKPLPITDEKGVVQMQVSAKCIIDFRQPAGMGTEKEPTSATIANDVAAEMGEKAARVTLSIEPSKPVKLDADINAGAMTAALDFANVHFTAPEDPSIEGVAYAHRDGDFALLAVGMCGGGEFAEQGDGMQRFIESSRADVTY
ncbi:hypothetical protein ACFWHR_05550 [Leucobacter sp. NPDC058333]|uniref:hypothetical protein n=1 Tax=Leucobacter sp. NPDC058333 TaxID=3346450 RepID=UPI003657FB43